MDNKQMERKVNKNKKQFLDCKPFVKWAGGKRQLLNDLLYNIPSNFNNYFEPFVGGGALFFKLRSIGFQQFAYLFDTNDELINLYIVIRDNCSDLIDEIENGKYENSRDFYYWIRSMEFIDPIKRAARFLYLNKAGYNGLYRVNSKGKFNVPFGRYKNLKIMDKNLLYFNSIALKNTKICNYDFENALSFAQSNDFIYFDPPYIPLSQSSSFTKYTSGGFTIDDHIRLSVTFKELDRRNCYVLLSNSSTEIVKSLYSGYKIREVKAKRTINCIGNSRGAISELIITNY